MGLWSFVLPEATTNLISNPSFEVGTTGWTAVGGSIARSSAKQTKGLYSLAVTPTGAGDGVYCALTLETTTEYTFSIDVWGAAGVDYRIYLYDVTAAAILGSAVSFEADGNWRRYVVTATTGANTSIRVYVEVVDASIADFYIDAAQIEEKGYATTYCDGDQDGCAWAAGEHSSTSARSAQSAAGGRVIDLNSAGYELEVRASIGVGHAPIELIESLPAQGIGGDFQDQVIRPRDFQLVGTIPGTDRADYHTNRLNLINAFNPHRLASKQPVQLRYNLSGRSAAIDGYYVDGLGKNQQAGPTLEEIALRFRAENPLFRAVTGHNNGDRCGGQGALAATVQQELASVNYIIQRTPGGVWQKLGTGLNGLPNAFVIGPDGTLYAGGEFTTAGGGGANRIAKWDGSSWSALGSGLNGIVHALAFGPDGSLYACGAFTTAGGGAANRIAKWDGSSWSALGSGLNGVAYALAVGPDGTVYVGGSFTTAGGGAASCIASWDGSSWSALGAGMNDIVYTLVVGPDGTLYAGGAFTTAGGGAANRVAAWNGSAWSALNSGLNGTVWASAIGPDGTLYVGGAFTTAGGISAIGIAKWNGTKWSPMYTVTGNVWGMHISPPTNELFAAGNISYANGIPAKLVASWRGSQWYPIDMTLPAAATEARGIIVSPDGHLTIGFDNTGTVVSSVVTTSGTLTNSGSCNAYPIFKTVGPGRIYKIENVTTGEIIDFNIDLLDGETVILDMRPGKKTVTSTFRGNVIHTIREGSDLKGFHLMPGENAVSIFVDDATAEAFLLWEEFHWSIDGVVA
jgi:hypothetical protein